MEVPHGIPTSRKTFKSWREFKERQHDSALATTRELNWETLASRRKTAILSFMYKLSHKLTDFSVAAHLKPNSERRTRGSHPFKFAVSRAKKDVFKFSFFPRTISVWNSLPEDIVNTTSVDIFSLVSISFIQILYY